MNGTTPGVEDLFGDEVCFNVLFLEGNFEMIQELLVFSDCQLAVVTAVVILFTEQMTVLSPSTKFNTILISPVPYRQSTPNKRQKFACRR